MSHTTDQLEGFEDLLQVAGRDFLHGNSSFRALVKRLDPLSEDFDLTPADDDSVLICAIRGQIPTDALKVGTSFSDTDGFVYRVTRIHRSPGSLVARLECTVLNP